VSRPAPTVLVRGGGYFTDIWPDEFRAFLDACERYRDSRLVLMPQTVGRLSEDTIDAARLAIARHGRVTMLLRDRRSVEMAQQLFPGVDAQLSPDAAQCLSGDDLRRLQPRRGDYPSVRVIARCDAEADSSLSSMAAESGIPVFDFVDAPSGRANRVFRELHEIVRARLPRPVAAALISGLLPQTRMLDLHAKGEVRRAVGLIAGAERIVTDRLHATIIASILEIDVTAVDTGYGKLSGYFEAWPSTFVTFAENAQAALREVT
jgi:exopolysaccharide biosynthesis predicted pyruvyltransferase EpsI